MIWKLSRFSRLHNFFRIIFNSTAFMLPDRLKYSIGKMVRSKRLPYRLVAEGSVVVQIGCPWDILHAGRSRGIYFSIFAGKSGQVVIIEPDRQNLEKLKAFLKKNAMENVTVVEKGAWSKPDRLRFLTDPNHPAANLVESVFDPHRIDRDGFQATEISVDSVDHILSSLGISDVDLISITTNGSEREIVDGMSIALSHTRYLSVVAGDEAAKTIQRSGFELIGDDDRGKSYQNVKFAPAQVLAEIS